MGGEDRLAKGAAVGTGGLNVPERFVLGPVANLSY
jgi:hypothetical protein